MYLNINFVPCSCLADLLPQSEHQQTDLPGTGVHAYYNASDCSPSLKA